MRVKISMRPVAKSDLSQHLVQLYRAVARDSTRRSGKRACSSGARIRRAGNRSRRSSCSTVGAGWLMRRKMASGRLSFWELAGRVGHPTRPARGRDKRAEPEHGETA